MDVPRGETEHSQGYRVVSYDACRTIAVDAWDRRRRRRSWAITYLDPKAVDAEPARGPGLLERLRGFLG